MTLLLQAIYFYLPGAVANIGANLGKRIPLINKLNSPIDAGICFRGKRLIGEHKFWSGLIFGILLGMLAGVLKYQYLDAVFPNLVVLQLSFWQNLLLSSILATGALAGDLIKSFFKRQLEIKPHSLWIPFDEIDHTTVALLTAKAFFNIPWELILVALAVFFVLHIISNFVGYYLHLKSVPY